MRLRGLARFGAAARLHQHDWFAGRARASAGGKELLRSANLLAVERDHAGRAVVSQEFEEIGAFEPRLVAGRDHVGQREAAPIGSTLEVAEQASALADKGNASLDAALRLARVEHVQPYPVHVVGDAEAIRSHDGKSARPRGGGDGVLRRLIADLGEPGGEYESRAGATARAGLDRRGAGSALVFAEPAPRRAQASIA